MISGSSGWNAGEGSIRFYSENARYEGSIGEKDDVVCACCAVSLIVRLWMNPEIRCPRFLRNVLASIGRVTSWSLYAEPVPYLRP
ncbi:uncharacterized protein BDW47DRAFT_62074 [Aspergillus candidus]|uniref:Uncharacterized protein n=1 Tax=Aspergillus candidus TaxID=41067 RepID=A0A2I2F462_ASPCN|nr:hypothetical protein BDW47DRAFT_62074 [Aspergillus candidus]PLB35424.1 hypothetical protein BDW47DRAFT_62074 [Aspergillus candidus]